MLIPATAGPQVAASDDLHRIANALQGAADRGDGDIGAELRKCGWNMSLQTEIVLWERADLSLAFN